jgi:dinuclear metal center YbgI/SA1388 family protein
MITVASITQILETFAPVSLQESYDNSGLITGQFNMEVTGVLLCLDCLETVIDEAIEQNCNLIVAHHPIVFSGLKRLNGANYIERVVIKAIKNDIAIYACHTNLDNVINGVNHKIAEKLGLHNAKILAPKHQKLQQMYFYVPNPSADMVREVIFKSCGGQIGNYTECSFNVQGSGTFKATELAQPKIGIAGGGRNSVDEVKIEFLTPDYLSKSILAAVQALSYYEEKPYGIIDLANSNQEIGSGLVAELLEPIPVIEFLTHLRTTMEVECIRHTTLTQPMIKRVAICGGSGSFLLKAAKSAKADVFISADFKYHEFFDADNEIIIADIGHYESEHYTIELFHEILTNKLPNFAIRFSGINTNPIKYFK